MARNSDYDFAGKYTKEGAVGRWLVDRFYAALAELLQECSGPRHLEVGCGEGFSTQRVNASLPPDSRLFALDVEPRLVRAAAERNPGVRLCLGSAYDLPLRDGSFDTVLALEVLEHLETPDRALRELTRVARRWVVLSVPREPIWRLLNLTRLRYVGALGNTPGHLQHWSRRGFLAFVSRAGRVRAVRSPLPWTQVLLEC
ncbi:class I SAM-dependent methyltransferase [Deferrisoma sp.]